MESLIREKISEFEKLSGSMNLENANQLISWATDAILLIDKKRVPHNYLSKAEASFLWLAKPQGLLTSEGMVKAFSAASDINLALHLSLSESTNTSVDMDVEHRKNNEVTAVSEVSHAGDHQKWSDTKNWTMGLAATVILGILGWVGSEATIILKGEQASLIEQISPKDGETFNHYPRTLKLQWSELSGTVRYILEVEIHSSGKWHPHPNQYRFVTTDTMQSLQFIGAQPGRWRVTGIGQREQAIGKSPWWYFHFSR